MSSRAAPLRSDEPGDEQAPEAIARIADELVPALSAALAASGLAEIELRQAGWRVRVRRGASAASDGAEADAAPHRRRAERPGRSHAAERGRSADGRDDRDASNGSGPRPLHEPADPPADPARAADRFRVVAPSPAVGPFRPGRDLRTGTRVRAGDALGSVDVLGVPQEVSAPADGIVMAVLVEAGDAVEYGQPLVELERATSSAPASSASPPGPLSSTPAGAGEG